MLSVSMALLQSVLCTRVMAIVVNPDIFSIVMRSMRSRPACLAHDYEGAVNTG